MIKTNSSTLLWILFFSPLSPSPAFCCPQCLLSCFLWLLSFMKSVFFSSFWVSSRIAVTEFFSVRWNRTTFRPTAEKFLFKSVEQTIRDTQTIIKQIWKVKEYRVHSGRIDQLSTLDSNSGSFEWGLWIIEKKSNYVYKIIINKAVAKELE